MRAVQMSTGQERQVTDQVKRTLNTHVNHLHYKQDTLAGSAWPGLDRVPILIHAFGVVISGGRVHSSVICH